ARGSEDQRQTDRGEREHQSEVQAADDAPRELLDEWGDDTFTSAKEEVHGLVAGLPELGFDRGAALVDCQAIVALFGNDDALRQGRLHESDLVDILIGNTDAPSAVGIRLHLRGVATALNDDDDILERLALVLDVAAENEVILIRAHLVGNRGARHHGGERKARKNGSK